MFKFKIIILVNLVLIIIGSAKAEQVSSLSINPNRNVLDLVAVPANKLGYGIVKAVIETANEKNRPKDIYVNDDTKEIISKIDKSFKKSQIDRIGIELIAANSNLVVGVVTYGLATSLPGLGSVISAVVGKKMMEGIDKASTKIIETDQKSVIANLVSQRASIETALGFPLEKLAGDSAENIKEKLKNINLVEKSLLDSVVTYGDDKENRKKAIEEMTLDVTIDALKNIQVEGFRKIENNTEEIKNSKKRFLKFVKNNEEFHSKIISTLDNQGKKLSVLSNQVEDLNSKMHDMNQALSEHGKQLSFLSDIAFSQMTPGEKATSLKSGMFSGRFSCTESISKSECNSRKKLKEKLIETFESEQNLQDKAKNLSLFTSDLQSVSQIASNLGVDIPLLDDAISLSSRVSNAFNAQISGHPLAAIAAVSSLFGKGRSDPTAERHKKMMKYLAKQFEIVNKKLDKILDNQVKILKSLEQLSIQSAEQYRALDERLANIEFDGKLTLKIVKSILRDKWKSCNLIYNIAVFDRDRSKISDDFDDFDNLDGIFNLLQNQAFYNSARECIQVSNENFISLQNVDSFGNFLSLRYAFKEMQRRQVHELYTLKELAEERKYFDFSELEKFLNNTHTLSLKLLAGAKGFKQQAWQKIFIQSAYPATSLKVTEVPDNVCRANSGREPEKKYLGAALRVNLCDIKDNTKPKIAKLNGQYYSSLMLNEPADIYFTAELTDWILISSRVKDVSNSEGGFHKSTRDFLEKASETNDFIPQGLSDLKSLESVLNYVIASRSVLYSRPSLDAIHESYELKNKTQFSRSISLIRNNEYLKHNLAVKLLYENFIGRSNGRSNFRAGSHRFLLSIILEDPRHSVGGLAELFTKKDYYKIKFNELNNWPNVCFASELSTNGNYNKWDVCTSFPIADTLSEGSLQLPEFIYKLVAMRNKVQDRIGEYHSFNTLEEGEIKSIVNTLSY